MILTNSLSAAIEPIGFLDASILGSGILGDAVDVGKGTTSSLGNVWWPNELASVVKPFSFWLPNLLPSPGTWLESGLCWDKYLSVNEQFVMVRTWLRRMLLSKTWQFETTPHVVTDNGKIYHNKSQNIAQSIDRNTNSRTEGLLNSNYASSSQLI